MKTLIILFAFTLTGCTTIDTTLKTLNPTNPVNSGKPIVVTYTWNV